MTESNNIDFLNAYKNNNINQMKTFKNKFDQNMAILNYCIDESVEEGNIEIAKFLVLEFKTKPSLYAKEMAMVNKHFDLIQWINSNVNGTRNQTGISGIHRKFDKNCGTFIWPEWIPIDCQLWSMINLDTK